MRKLSAFMVFVAAQILASCVPVGSSRAPTSVQGSTRVQLALGFVPSVQSAPYYLAEDRGYYAAEGLQVELRYGTIQNLLELVSNGDVTFASASGDSLMPQRQQGVNITYIPGHC